MPGSGNTGAAPRPREIPAYRRLYEQIRDGILAGQLVAGSRLPATRNLAAETGVSRNTVLAAFDQLHAEGYLESRQGSGTYVARSLPETMLTPRDTHDRGPLRRDRSDSSQPSRLSRRGRDISDAVRMPLPSVTGVPADTTAFQIGLPAIGEFPFELWTRLCTARMRESARELMRYGDPAGYFPLRAAIASYVATARGIHCTPEQVVVVSGSQQGLECCARLLLDPGDAAWIEDPGYLGARAALASAGATVVPVPVDRDGLDVSAGIAREPSARLAIVTPSYQFPMAVTLTLERRLALLDWASTARAWVIEDDYDSQFHYRSRPLAALQAIDRDHRVIYVGTFSKVIFPGLRLGYLIVPLELVDAFRAAHLCTDVHSHLLDQAVLSDFMRTGHFSAHLRRMRIVYGNRLKTLLQESKRLHERMRVPNTSGGLHVVGWLTDDADDTAVAAAAARQNLHVWPMSMHCLTVTLPPALLLGYSGTTERDIHAGIDTLAAVLSPSTPDR